MYKITPPSQQTYKGPKLQQNPISQLQNNETLTEEVLQSSTEQYREQLEQMLDLKPSIRGSQLNKQNNKNDLWNTIQYIEKRMQVQEQNLQKVNNEKQEEINKLKSEIKQQKQQYEQEIEEIKSSSRIQSQKTQSYNSYTPKNNREQSYRSVNNNNIDEMQEKIYLQQLVQDLRQQIQTLQQKNYFTTVQSNTDNIWEQKYRQLEKQKETELSMKDQHHVERISNLEIQLLNQKQSYESEVFAMRKILDEKSKEDSQLRNQNQQLQKDLNCYINQFNLLSQQLQSQNQQIQQYQIQLSQLQNQLQQQQSINNQHHNQQFLELANQLQVVTNLLDNKNQECEYYKQKSLQNQQPLQQNQQIITYRQALTPTRQNTIQKTSDSIVFPTLTKQQVLQQFQ